MPSLSVRSLKNLLYRAFTEGYQSSLDMKEVICDEMLINSLYEEKESENEGFKIYTASELRQYPVNSIFNHQTKGIGCVVYQNNERFMRFFDGTHAHFFSDDYPWNFPMIYIGTANNS